MAKRMRTLSAVLAGVGAVALLGAPSALARDYEVTIQNLASGQPLSPPVVATHHDKHAVFQVGQPASVGIREIAENGNNAPLLAFLNADPFNQFEAVEEGSHPLVPAGRPGSAMFGDSTTFQISSGPRSNRLSYATMLICTNDGFTGVDGMKLPRRVGDSRSQVSDGYDAFTEVNTEDYADMVPPCQALIGDSSGEPGTGVSNPALAEGGVIRHHAGIQGTSDLKPDIHGWQNPVARITVERTG